MKSLFIGRWQPFHKGHRKIIESELEAGNEVVIAIRDTKISEQNPFTVKERKKFIRKEMKRWGDRIELITVPDIERVCYGRTPGWEIKQIRLEPKLEAISGTKIRKYDSVAHR